MPLHPWPHIMHAGRRLTVGLCRVGVPGEPDSMGYAGPGAQVPGGALEPATFNGMTILGFKQGAPATTFFFALLGGGLPQNAFERIIIPGVNNGAPLMSADASLYTSIWEATTFTWWEWTDLPAAPPVDGDVFIS